MGKILSRGLLALYLVTLIWLVLFKLQYNILSVFNYHQRSLNLTPFTATGNFREMIDNVIIFIPFGLLLNVNFNRIRQKSPILYRWVMNAVRYEGYRW